MFKNALIAAAGFALMSGSAHAITGTFEVTASNYSVLFMGSTTPPPLDPAYIEFSVTFDPSVVTDPTSTGLTIVSTNLPDADFPAEFSYNSMGIFTIATDAGLGYFGDPSNSFGISLYQLFSPSPLAFAFEQTTSVGSIWQAVDIAVSSVPEPASWSLMLMGLGGLGAALRARRERSPVISPV